jgi:CheY-like chemotaxis protein
MADAKMLGFGIELDPALPATIYTDSKRLQQVIKNLLSNAFKFTSRGQIDLRIAPASGSWSADHHALNGAEQVVAFAVSDTGIGIPLDKQKVIFEAFQQADGSTSRKYGGTGLGLSISREIANVLGGEIRLTSTPGKGSTFTLYLPLDYTASDPGAGSAPPATGTPPATRRTPSPITQPPSPAPRSPIPVSPVRKVPTSQLAQVTDDRESIKPVDRTVLIVEDDVAYASLLLDAAHKKGFRGVVSPEGGPALALAKQFKPDAITLDIGLPDVDGWTVLDRLKLDAATRHIPVHVISIEQDREHALQRGALSYLENHRFSRSHGAAAPRGGGRRCRTPMHLGSHRRQRHTCYSCS